MHMLLVLLLLLPVLLLIIPVVLLLFQRHLRHVVLLIIARLVILVAPRRHEHLILLVLRCELGVVLVVVVGHGPVDSSGDVASDVFRVGDHLLRSKLHKLFFFSRL